MMFWAVHCKLGTIALSGRSLQKAEVAAGRREALQEAQLRKALDRLAKSERLAAGEMQRLAQVPAVAQFIIDPCLWCTALEGGSTSKGACVWHVASLL